MKTEDKLTIAKIPVIAPNPSDKTDQALRRFSADWLRENVKEVSVDTRFEKLRGGTVWINDTTLVSTPIIGALVITWWPKPPMGEYEMLLASQRARRKEAEKS